jgi:5-methylcytosine-specific restriction endonuclease McrA
VLIFWPAPDWKNLIHRIHLCTRDSMRIRHKPRVKLSPEEYTVVRKKVLERDSWRCQDCGAIKELQVHHIKPRSQLGGDVMQNLIALCATCHGKRHRRVEES